MSDPVTELALYMETAGVPPANRADIKANLGKWQDFDIAGQRKGSKKGSYILDVFESGYAKASFIDFKGGGSHISWTNWEEKELTEEQKAEIKEATKKQKKMAEKKKADDRKYAAKKASELQSKGDVEGISQHPYIQSKQIQNIGSLTMSKAAVTDPKDKERDPNEQVVLIPAYKNRKLVGLQKIYEDGSKKFVFGTDIEGSFCPVAREGTPTSKIILCEGYATADAIFQAMDCLTLACFNAGNLKHVAKYIKEKHPDSEVIIAADNDQWTEIRGKKVNTGINKAKEIGSDLDIAVVFPNVPEDDAAKRTDFNDILVTDGVNQIVKDFSRPLVAENAPADTCSSSLESVRGASIGGGSPNLPALMEEQPGWSGLPFRPLGIDTKNAKKYWYYDLKMQDLIELSAAQHSKMAELQALAMPDEWRAPLTGGHELNGSQLASHWSQSMIQYGKNLPRFNETRDVRGVGAWMDGSRVVTNCGRFLYCDDVKMRLGNLTDSKFVYTSSSDVSLNPADEALTDEEAKKFYDVCQMPNWEDPLSGVLFAGWLVCSLVSGSLPWRPHIWISAESGSGKSTIKREMILKVLGDFALDLGGSMTTEAGIRVAIKRDPRPVILDDVDGSSHIERILQLARISSSAQKTANYDGSSEVRSCFCILSILTQDMQFADANRFTQLTLKKDNSPGASQKYNDVILPAMKSVLTKEYAQKLHKRIIKNMPYLYKNIDTFRKAATLKLSSARDADQISAMLAGAVLLHREGEFTLEEAVEKVDSYAWDHHTAIQEANTGESFLDVLTTTKIKVGNEERSLGWAVCQAGGYLDATEEYPSMKQAQQALTNYGIIAGNNSVGFYSQNRELKKLLMGTHFESQSLNSILTKLSGVKQNQPMRFPGNRRQFRCTTIPWSYFVDTPEIIYENTKEA